MTEKEFNEYQEEFTLARELQILHPEMTLWDAMIVVSRIKK